MPARAPAAEQRDTGAGIDAGDQDFRQPALGAGRGGGIQRLHHQPGGRLGIAEFQRFREVVQDADGTLADIAALFIRILCAASKRVSVHSTRRRASAARACASAVSSSAGRGGAALAGLHIHAADFPGLVAVQWPGADHADHPALLLRRPERCRPPWRSSWPAPAARAPRHPRRARNSGFSAQQSPIRVMKPAASSSRPGRISGRIWGRLMPAPGRTPGCGCRLRSGWRCPSRRRCACRGSCHRPCPAPRRRAFPPAAP